VTQNFVTAYILDFITQQIGRHFMRIIHPPTADAPHVMVLLRIAVEASLCPTDLQFLDDTTSGEELQIAVHSAQADSGQMLAYYLIQVSR